VSELGKRKPSLEDVRRWLIEDAGRWFDEHGRTSDPVLDGLRYAAAHSAAEASKTGAPEGRP